jgi:hypothetical protein
MNFRERDVLDAMDSAMVMLVVEAIFDFHEDLIVIFYDILQLILDLLSYKLLQ